MALKAQVGQSKSLLLFFFSLVISLLFAVAIVIKKMVYDFSFDSLSKCENLSCIEGFFVSEKVKRLCGCG